jgi:hypothetical protein
LRHSEAAYCGYTPFLKPKALVFLCRKEAECGGYSNFKRDLAWKIDAGTADGSERVKSSILSE